MKSEKEVKGTAEKEEGKMENVEEQEMKNSVVQNHHSNVNIGTLMSQMSLFAGSREKLVSAFSLLEPEEL